MDKLMAKAEITINAPVSRVWEALTDPKQVKQYFFGTDVASTWEVGSPLTFSGEWEGKSYEDKGTILNKDPNKLLQFSYWSSMSGKPDLPENYANITYRLSENEGVTTLVVTQDNITNKEGQEHSQQNWGIVLGNLKKLLETGN
ncbi:SRPBCC family protein [Polluticoccus soli]|uniref:SRPBCC family protein n=1 Tax=Polluticoccus soli TaxID=3034150 RepID=UPI0023E23153|nr:SRPBCC domain-containing protein [Flavipsychrobacter sp. JY13-12]